MLFEDFDFESKKEARQLYAFMIIFQLVWNILLVIIALVPEMQLKERIIIFIIISLVSIASIDFAITAGKKGNVRSYGFVEIGVAIISIMLIIAMVVVMIVRY